MTEILPIKSLLVDEGISIVKPSTQFFIWRSKMLEWPIVAQALIGFRLDIMSYTCTLVFDYTLFFFFIMSDQILCKYPWWPNDPDDRKDLCQAKGKSPVNETSSHRGMKELHASHILHNRNASMWKLMIYFTIDNAYL